MNPLPTTRAHCGAVRAAAGLAWLALLGAAGGCISERSPVDVTELADCAVPLQAVARGDLLVLIRDFSFLPDTLRVPAGRVVTWVNCEGPAADPHTATAADEAWTSALLRRAEFFSRTFVDPGTFHYFCLPHPFMRGVVVVE
jgi:plastocyanin